MASCGKHYLYTGGCTACEIAYQAEASRRDSEKAGNRQYLESTGMGRLFLRLKTFGLFALGIGILIWASGGQILTETINTPAFRNVLPLIIISVIAYVGWKTRWKWSPYMRRWLDERTNK